MSSTSTNRRQTTTSISETSRGDLHQTGRRSYRPIPPFTLHHRPGRVFAPHALDPDATRAFVERAFRNGAIPTTGAAVTAILPPTSRFAADDAYGIKKQTVLDRLAVFFDRYFALG